ncbi:MAG: hypothetical protein ACOY4K_01820 [Pseudomonadota bacterium]
MPSREDRSFNPTTPEANRAAHQGGGVGQREMEAQRDPVRTNESEREQAEANAALAEEAEGPIEGLQQGRTATNRDYDPASETLQGPKTRRANRERVKGSPDMNP